MIYNILIVGVGGQGTLLASRVLGSYAVLNNYDCKLSEVHGMSQRGGSVVTHVRMGDEPIYSPIVPLGGADIVIAFEKLEAMRWRHYLKKNGMMVVNDQEIMPMPVITGAMRYPHTVIDDMRAEGIDVHVVDAYNIAESIGNTKAVNTIMLGALASSLHLDYDRFEEALTKTVPAKYLELNKIALKRGFDIK